MKENQTILVINRIPPCEFPTSNVQTSIQTFDEPNKAIEHLNTVFEAEKKRLAENAECAPEDINVFPQDNETRRRIITQKSGEQHWDILGTRYHVAWMTIPGKYNVSDDEVFRCLDAYVNSSRSASDYKTMAERIASKMHRYCQNELWKFVKALIRAFAAGGHDDRNRTAHQQAGDVLEFMEKNNI